MFFQWTPLELGTWDCVKVKFLVGCVSFGLLGINCIDYRKSGVTTDGVPEN